MKVQYAMDGLLDECLEKAERYRDRLDVIEIGEKIIYHESQNIIPKIKKMFSDKKVVVDLKFMDGGYNFSRRCLPSEQI
jgi:3-keto-L-gulonate-6-phosphate decarboxylase